MKTEQWMSLTQGDKVKSNGYTATVEVIDGEIGWKNIGGTFLPRGHYLMKSWTKV